MDSNVVRTRAFSALGYDFVVEVEGQKELGAYVATLFQALSPCDREAVCWTVRRRSDGDGFWEFVVDDEVCRSAPTAADLAPQLVQGLNPLAIAAWDGVVLHAGGVASDGCGVILPADSESGKTTLTAGLVRAGFEYLTDEAVALHRGSNRIEPYPKPLSIDPGSWFLFPELEPQVHLDGEGYKREQWQVTPDAIRSGSAGAPCPARLVIFPTYGDGVRTSLRPMSRVEALVELAKNTFEFNADPRRSLEELARVVRAVDCYRLDVGSLDVAVALIGELMRNLPIGLPADV